MGAASLSYQCTDWYRRLAIARDCIHLHFTASGHHFDHTFIVVPAFSHLCILGLDFFMAHNWTKPYPNKDIFSFRGLEVPFRANPMMVNSRYTPVTIKQERVIDPKQSVTCLGHIKPSDKYSPGDLGIIKPNELMPSFHNLHVPHTVSHLHDYDGHRVVVNITNNTSKPMVVPANTIVAYFSTSDYTEIMGPADIPYLDSQGQPPNFDFDKFLSTHSFDTEAQKAEAHQLLKRIARVFARDPRSPPPNLLVTHHIDTGQHQPIRTPIHRTSPAEDEALRKELLMMLDKGIVRPSHSPWANPLVMVSKPDGSTRTCFDARGLNSITKRDAYTLPRADDLMSRFHGAKFFTTYDAAAGWWQVPLDESSIEKTAFLTKFGLFEFLKMPFGITNATASFQRLIDLVLGGLRFTCVAAFADDGIIYSPTWEQHLIDVETVMGKLIEARISLRLDKCRFAQREVRFLGYQVSDKGITIDPRRIQAVKALPPPTSTSMLRSVLGLFSYYRKLVKGFANIAEPLLSLLRQEGPKGAKKPKAFTWGQDQQQAFDELKHRLISQPILAHPDLTLPFVLHTDASSTAIGAILSQNHDEKEVVIGYFSKTLTPQERDYSTTEREALAIVRAVEFFKPFLHGPKFTVVTDHASLRHLMSIKDPSGRIARWIMILQAYDFSIEHRRGKLHTNADAMTRPPMLAAMITQLQDIPPLQDIKQHQRDDPVLSSAYLSYFEMGDFSRVPEEIKPLLVDIDNYCMIRGVLFHIWTPRHKGRRLPHAGTHLQLAVPHSLRAAVLSTHHESPMAGHRGIDPTYMRIRQHYYWPNMYADVVRWVNSWLPSMCHAEKAKARAIYRPPPSGTYLRQAF